MQRQQQRRQLQAAVGRHCAAVHLSLCCPALLLYCSLYSGPLTKGHLALQLEMLHHQPHIPLNPRAPAPVNQRATAGGDTPRHRLQAQAQQQQGRE